LVSRVISWRVDRFDVDAGMCCGLKICVGAFGCACDYGAAEAACLGVVGDD